MSSHVHPPSALRSGFVSSFLLAALAPLVPLAPSAPLAPLALLAPLSGIALAGCRHQPLPDPPEAPPGEAWITAEKARAAGITVAPVGFRELDRVLGASARITFDDQRVAHVFSPVNGRVSRLVAPLGARVNRGDPLAVIDSPDLGSALSDAVKAQSVLEAAERELERQRELFAAHASAQRDLEAAESGERQARAELERARAKTRLLAGRDSGGVSQSFILRAPIAGEVISRALNPGAEVQGQYAGGTAAELYTVGELDHVWVVADVFEMDLRRVALGAPVTLSVIAYPGRGFQGRVDWIAGGVDPSTRTAKVRCAIANPDRALRPEMYATVSIAVPGRRELALPRAALLRQGDQTVVFREAGRAPDGRLRFERWPVKVEDEGSDSLVAVQEGLRPGDRVVTAGGILLLGMV